MPKHSILAVFAHPDDETTSGPLLAKYARAGHDVYLASITSGQKGVRKHFGMMAGAELAAVREGELRCAAAQLGIHEPFLLGFEDQGISGTAAAVEVAKAVRGVIEQTRPDVIVTWGPDGITGHVDHRAASDVATLVFQQQGLLEHKPRKLYYVAFPESRFELTPAALRRGRTLYSVSDAFITTEEDCGECIEAAIGAIECHKSQWAPDFMEQFKEMYRRVFAGRVYLRLALSFGISKNGRRESSILDGL